ncbi:hypothetical protein EDWATA_00328 [Edwardsiella tarda ATCC 23685]|uniref:Uncharacterized protein n=1 Tax=Edwardsiella tarda ATCC 23685 TaxID=500638 RepID=D4F0U8_EDWTA|nr:hypothetical protein EDWATA_00328 [Edwardsiella tarda ATCC 23685]
MSANHCHGERGWSLTSLSFCFLLNRLIRYSTRSASPCAVMAAWNTSVSGPLPRNALAPRPLWCCARRRAISVVIPVYSAPVAVRKIYRYQRLCVTVSVMDVSCEGV